MGKENDRHDKTKRTMENKTAYLSEILPGDSGNRGPETRHTLCYQKLGDLVNLRSVLLLILEMGEVETKKPICLKLQESRSNNSILEVDGITAYVAGPWEDEAAVIGYHKLVSDELATDAEPTVEEGREPARHYEGMRRMIFAVRSIISDVVSIDTAADNRTVWQLSLIHI